MTGDGQHRPKRVHRNDRAGALGGVLLAGVLGALTYTGYGPWDQRQCRETTASTPMLLDLETSADGLLIAGTLASEADRAVIVQAAGAVFGEVTAKNDTRVDSSVAPLGWKNNAQDLMRALKSLDPPARMRIEGEELIVSGWVSDNNVRKRIAAAAASALGPAANVMNLLSVRPTGASASYVTAGEPPQVDTAAAPAPPVAVAALEPLATIAPAPVPVTAPPAQSGPQRTLPNGKAIEIKPDGLESLMIGFLEDASRAIDHQLWFDFDALTFETGSPTLTPPSMEQLKTVAAILLAYPASTVKVGSYTANSGDPASNRSLSSSRAETAVKALIGLGIAPDRLEWEGYGDNHPQGHAKAERTALSIRRK